MTILKINVTDWEAVGYIAIWVAKGIFAGYIICELKNFIIKKKNERKSRSSY